MSSCVVVALEADRAGERSDHAQGSRRGHVTEGAKRGSAHIAKWLTTDTPELLDLILPIAKARQEGPVLVGGREGFKEPVHIPADHTHPQAAKGGRRT